MSFDVRHWDYTFKHTMSPKPDLNAARFKEHFHTTYEFLYFVCGDADFVIKNTLYKLKPGSLLIVKPGEYHNVLLHSAAPYERYVIRFAPQAIYPYVRKQLAKAKSVYYIEGSPLAAEFHRMDDHLANVHHDIQLSACIGSMNIIISYLVSSQELIQKADYINEDSRAIVDYIESHLATIHTAEDVAQALHISKSTLYKVFSGQFDTSVMSYIRTQKCMIARDLLSEGIPASTVAERLGFNHYSSFYRDYYHVFHAAPSAMNRTSTVS